MAQGLQLSQKMSLQQVLAPQLQQSLALLQAPTLELKALVEQELQQNPLLEDIGSAELSHEDRIIEEGDAHLKELDPTEPPADTTFDPASEKESKEPVDDFDAEFEKLLQQDQEWKDHFAQTNVRNRTTQDDEEKRQYLFDSLVSHTSLQEMLQEQVRLSDLDEEHQQIAQLIIGNIGDNGYLQTTPEELSFSTNILLSKISHVLKTIHGFHPPGVGARNLRECLMIQLDRDQKTSSLEYRIIDQHMELLGKRRFPEIARHLGVPVDQVQEAAYRIAHLEPCPGRDYLPENTQYISPDVFVQKVDDEYTVYNNNEQIPHLRISNTYKDIMSRSESTDEEKEYIREKIRAGKNLIKFLQQRQDTILNIAREIVRRQQDFMEGGPGKLKPMTMVQIAEVVGVHETTVSRAVSGKYIETPQGVFEMKYFFTSGIQTSSGKDISNTSVKGIIHEMIRKEPPNAPLSDEEIVKRLAKQEIIIARRTVAKYRSELNILPSHLRKVY